MPRDARYPDTSAVTAAWSLEQVRARLPDVGRTCHHLVRIDVSPTDFDMEQARVRSANRRRGRLIALGVLVACAALLVVFPRFRPASLSGLGGACLWGVVNVVLQYRYRRRVGSVPVGSHAEVFVRALLHPTAITRGIAGRWLGWNSPADAVLLTQEEHWSFSGPHGELTVRWTATEGAIARVEAVRSGWKKVVRVRFEDGSGVVLDLPERSRAELLGRWQPDP